MVPVLAAHPGASRELTGDFYRMRVAVSFPSERRRILARQDCLNLSVAQTFRTWTMWRNNHWIVRLGANTAG